MARCDKWCRVSGGNYRRKISGTSDTWFYTQYALSSYSEKNIKHKFRKRSCFQVQSRATCKYPSGNGKEGCRQFPEAHGQLGNASKGFQSCGRISIPQSALCVVCFADVVSGRRPLKSRTNPRGARLMPDFSFRYSPCPQSIRNRAGNPCNPRSGGVCIRRLRTVPY